MYITVATNNQNLHVLLLCHVVNLQTRQLHVASSEEAADTNECITGES